MPTITAIEAHHIRVPFDMGAPPTVFAGMAWTAIDSLFVRVVTDDGREGWGEGWGHAACAATLAALETMVGQACLGADATDVTGLNTRMAQRFHISGRGGPVTYALSAIDIAMWDLAAQRANQPLYQLLGGAPCDSLDAYASLLRYGAADAVAAAVGRATARGYREVKLHEIDLDVVRAARAAGGDALRMTLDTNCPWTVDEAIARARALAPCNLAWLEEPVWPPEDHAGLARVRREGGIPVAAGENAISALEFTQLFEAGSVDIAQPSVIKLGGITPVIESAQRAAQAGVTYVPHCAYFGPGYLASLHLGAALAPGAGFERLYLDLEASPYGAAVEAQAGRVAVPQCAGLGVAPDTGVIDRYRVGRAVLLR